MSGPAYSDLETYGLLKDLYDDDVSYQENVTHSLYNFCKHVGQGEINFDGNRWRIPAQLQLNESYAGLNDDEHLPDSDQIKGVFASYSPKKNYSTIDITTFAATRGHSGGRPDGKYLDSMVKSTFLSFMSNRDSDVYANGRGKRAVIATATAAASSFTVTMSTRLRPGMKLDWYDSTLATLRGSIKIAIKGISRIDRTVYVDTTFGAGAVPTGATAGDILVVYGALNAGEPTDGRFVAGFERMCDNTLSIGGLSPSTYAAWQATNINASLANPSQELLQQHWDWMSVISGLYPNRLAFNPAWKRAYLSSFLTQRQFTSNRYDTGASELSFSPVNMGASEKGKKIPEFLMLEDKNCFPTEYILWSYSAYMLASDYSDEPHLADEDGKEFRNRIGYDALQGFMRFWWNSVTPQRNAIGRAYNFATPSGVL